MKFCALKNCASRNNCDTTLFILPERSLFRHKWISFLEKNGIIYLQQKKYFLCSLHFDKSMIMTSNNRLRLTSHAYPVEVIEFIEISAFMAFILIFFSF